MSVQPVVFIIDVDGVMTDGRFYYTEHGKAMKVFGPDDHDGLSLLKPHMEIVFITGDSRGFPISEARIVRDMKMRLELVSTIKRIEWISERWPLEKAIYMGDGIFDHYVLKKVGYAIAPANADQLAKEASDFVTQRCGADRAVAEASLHILEKFFSPYNPDELPRVKEGLSGQWGV